MTSYKYSILSDIGGRTENQDYVLAKESPSGFLMIVCDGMGGANGGKLASETAAKAIAAVILNHKISDVSINESKYFITLLRRAITHANTEVFGLSRSQPHLIGMGTTACVALIRGNTAFLAHIGDSRIYHITRNETIHTNDHSRVFQLYQNGILTKEQAREHPESNIITRAIGIQEEVEAEYKEISLQPNDLIVLCSDGIWGVYPENQLIKKLKSSDDLDKLSKKLIESINSKYSKEDKRHDNLSLGLIKLNSSKDSEKESTTSSKSKEDDQLSSGPNIAQIILIIIILITIVLFIMLSLGSFGKV